MLSSNAPATIEPLPPGRYLVQLAAPGDPAPSGRFAVERVARRNVDERVQAEFVLCTPIDLVNRELRTNDRIHAERRYRGHTRTLVRRVEVKGGSVLLYPLRTTRGRKADPIDASSVAVMGLVTAVVTQFRL